MARDVVVASLTMYLRNRVISSGESSSSDEEWETALVNWNCGRRRRRIPRVQNYMTVVGRFLDQEFKSHFRMSRSTFDHILGLLHEDLSRTIPRYATISQEKQLMIALWKMANPESYRSVCDRFDVGKATGLRAVRRVTQALFQRAAAFIQWPAGERAQQVMHGFEETSAFPRVIGAIDGTHIAIDGPKENGADYVNRKGYHSVHLHVVCDHKGLITHCFAGYPGSVHDQRVFRNSEVQAFLGNPHKFPDDSHIVGDAAYTLHSNLLVPFKDNGHLTVRQKNYNFCQSSARIVVERCFALLKGRMSSLLDRMPMTRVDLMAEYIVACCVVHNVCMMLRDELLVINPLQPTMC